ncbi:MAG: hypothetical protein MK008_14910 [Bdellovibrionales bacterium]|nr:hypothetical protein [Bdellovibrionales bacterium]
MKILTSHPQWNTVVEVCQKLRAQGFQAVVAGGAVRDALRGVLPKDIDLATSAPASEVLKLFENSKYVGEHFGVVLINNQLEIASFRKEGEYKDGRHPETVELCSIEEDSKRRDFTINAMYFDPIEEKIIDLQGGQSDLEHGIIRSVGSSHKRFQEDHLRILRAYRFQAKTGFVFEESTYQAIKACHKSLNKISKERVQQELLGTLQEPFYYTAFYSMYESGSFQQICKLKLHFDSFHFYYALNNYHSAEFRWAGLLRDNLDVESELKTIKFSNHFIKSVKQYIESLKLVFSDEYEFEKKLLYLQDAQVQDYLELYQAWYNTDKFSDLIQKFLKLSDSERRLPKAIIDGKFLLNFGLKPGPEFEKYISQAYLLQLKEIIRTHEDAKLWVRSNLI